MSGRSAAALAALTLSGCGSITGMLWQDEFRPEYVVVNETHVLRRDAIQLGACDGKPALALEVERDDVPRSWRSLLWPAHDAGESGFAGALVCTASRRAALVESLLAPIAGRDQGLGVVRAALVLRVGAGIAAELPWKSVLLLVGRFPRAQVAEVLDRAEVERRYPHLAPLLDTDGNGEGYGLATRAFMNKPWLEWLGVAHPHDVRNRLLGLVDAHGVPLPEDERAVIAAAFDRDHGTSSEAVASLAPLTAVGRVLDDDHVTICYLAVPARTLLLANTAHVAIVGEELCWDLESDWQLEPRGHLPETFVRGRVAVPLQRVELALQMRKLVRTRGNSVAVKLLLTPLAVFADVVTCFTIAVLFGSDDDEDCRRW